jgi:hypothetical protein
MSTISMHRPTVYSMPVRQVPARAAQGERLVITRRGRIVLGTLIALPLLAIAYFFGYGASQAGADSTPSNATFETVTVMPGESLWTVATEVAPNADPQEVVTAIVSLNQLQSATVQPGQKLAIPAKYSK